MGVGEGVFFFGGHGFFTTGDGVEVEGGFLYVGFAAGGFFFTGTAATGGFPLSLGGKGKLGCLKKCQKKAEVHKADENLSFPAAGPRVCLFLSSDIDFVTILELPWEGQGSADALCSWA